MAVVKPAGRIRIFFIGASTTYGVSCPVEKTYPYLTGELLRVAMPEVDTETANAAMPGTSTAWILKRLEDIAPFKPDILIVTTGYNDAVTVYTNQVKVEKNEKIVITPWYFQLHMFLRRHSVLYTSIKEKMSLIYYETPNYELPWMRFLKKDPNPISGEWFKFYPDQFKNSLLQIDDWCQRHHVRLIFVEAPLRPGLERSRPLFAEALEALTGKLREASQERNIPTIQIQNLFQKSDVGKDFLDDVHFSISGHSKISRALADFLVPWIEQLRNAEAI